MIRRTARVGVLVFSFLMLVSLACTCGPLAQIRNTQATVQAAQTQVGGQLPTLQAGMTSLGPTIEAGLTEASAR